MKVSRNEMSAALQRAYEGAGYDIGDYEEAAELITWSEMCGLGGFASEHFPPQNSQQNILPQLDLEHNGIAMINANATHFCQYGSLAVHLACTLASRTDFACVHLINCINPNLILGSLAKIACKGFYLVAYWQQNGYQHGASFIADLEFPDYWSIPGSDTINSATTSSISILCTRQAALLANTIQSLNFKLETEYRKISQVQTASQYDQGLEQGIEVDSAQWDALNKAAWPVLVPATQQSSLGAGPG